MSETDPHIHVEKKVVETGAEFRNVVASTLGHVLDAPTVVTTGCGHQVPYAMTSQRPESVTCLACREHAHREYMKFADQVEHMCQMPGLNIAGITPESAAEAVARLREVAKRFSG
ncbi:hypothetical protein [Actinophytocola sp.]|uniref:hypothetical protein n=1 Tax=Actinophytocola sp. TaxID=1872138 RepID=UPI002ED0B6A4